MSTGRLHVLLRMCFQTQNVMIEMNEPEIENILNRLQAVIHEFGKVKSYVNLTLSWIRIILYELSEVWGEICYFTLRYVLVSFLSV